MAFLAFNVMWAQLDAGVVRGHLYDDKTGETILFGNVQVKGMPVGTVTDLEGAFTLKIEPGTYEIEFSYLGYSKLSIANVKVEPGKTVLLDARLKEESELLDEVVITASQARNTEAALATIKRLSSNVMDGISSSSFRKIGDSDAASALKRVTGVSVDRGKYIYVRGLGDRYSKTILNNVDVPGLDPDKNTLQMDIFPTNIIDNILVYKSFTADLAADFTGGLINVTTKDFPDSRTRSISVGMGYNPGMHFNPNWLTYTGGKTDAFGFDDGTRAIPTGRSENIPFRTDAIVDPNGEAGRDFEGILRGFNPMLGAIRQQSFMNYSLGFSTGNQKDYGKYKLGHTLSLTYQSNTEYFDEVEYSRWGLSGMSDEYEMNAREVQVGEMGTSSVLLGGLAGLSLKSEKSKYSINIIHLQNGESKAGIFDYEGSDLGSNFEAYQHNLEYTQRSLSSAIFDGTHRLGETGDWELKYVLAGIRSSIDDPDIRFTRIRRDVGNLTIGSESGFPERIWRYLEEYNYSGQLHLLKNYRFNGKGAKLKFGGSYTMKERSYEIQNFQIFTNRIKVTEDPNDLFKSENIWSPDNQGGITYDPLFIPNNPNKFDAVVSNAGVYMSNEFHPFQRMKAIVGLRLEHYKQLYSGINQSGDQFDREPVLDNVDLFPTINLGLWFE
jgi:hypothetical protein